MADFVLRISLFEEQLGIHLSNIYMERDISVEAIQRDKK